MCPKNYYGMTLKMGILLLSFCSPFCLALTTNTAPIENTQVVSPNKNFLFDATLLFLQPSDGQLHYVIEEANLSGDIPQQGDYKSITPHHDLSYGLKAGWRFLNSDSDLILQYHYSNLSQTSSATESESGKLFTTLGHPEWALENIESPEEADAEVRYRLDEMALEFGHNTRLSDRLLLHWVSGLNYTHLERYFQVRYVGGTLGDSVGVDVSKDNKFHGLGISGGVDGSYRLFQSAFSLFEMFRAVFLLGNLNMHMQGLHENESPNGEDELDVTSSAKNLLIPNVRIKLGLSYTPQTKNTAFKISVKAGYQIDQYFNANAQTFFIGYRRDGDLDEYDGLSQKRYDDISFNGLFLTISLTH